MWIALTFIAITHTTSAPIAARPMRANLQLADARKPSPLSQERQRLREIGEREGLWSKIERECL